MKTNFEPKRLTQARTLKMLNMTELAERVGLTRQAISQFEKGMAPSSSKLRELANALDVSARFFTKPLSIFEKNQNSVPSFRSFNYASARARKQALGFLELTALITDSLTKYVELPKLNLPDFNIQDFVSLTNDDIEEYANKTRSFFGFGIGPISNITMLMENQGVIIANINLQKGLDGLCTWFNDRPFVLVNPKGSAVRIRFDLSHELGHLILHKNLIDISDLEDKNTLKLIEQQANYFAGCFLMPESSFGAEVYGLDLDTLISLKKRWGVSIAAMIMRLHNLGIISESKRTRMFQMLNSKNMRRIEPLDKSTQKETPMLFKKILSVLKDAKILSDVSLREITTLSTGLLSKLTAIPEIDLSLNTTSDNVIKLRE